MSHFDFVLWTASFVTFFSTVCESQNDIYLPTEKWRQFHGFIYLCKNNSQQLARVYQRTFEKQNDLHIQKWKFWKIHFIFIVSRRVCSASLLYCNADQSKHWKRVFFLHFFQSSTKQQKSTRSSQSYTKQTHNGNDFLWLQWNCLFFFLLFSTIGNRMYFSFAV